MDIFDVLTAIVKRKLELMLSGINEHEALMNAEIDVSEEYHISLLDIKKLIERGLNNNGIYKHNPFIFMSSIAYLSTFYPLKR